MEKYSPAKKHLGQHFLYDKRILAKIVKACDLVQDEKVLEVGPGRGHLTDFLAETGADITAVEIDTDLYNGPLQKFHTSTNVNVLFGDVRDIELEDFFPVPFRYKFVANLPYNSDTNILRLSLIHISEPTRPY